MTKNRTIYAGLLAAAFLSLFYWIGIPAQAATTPTGWHDTGIEVPRRFANGLICFDNSQPGLIWSSNSEPRKGEIGITSLNLNTGQIGGISGTYNLCNPYTGLMYDQVSNISKPSTSILIDKNGGPERTLDHAVTHFAMDGTSQSYSLEVVELHVPSMNIAEFNTKLFASLDGGLTWEQRGQSLGTQITDLWVSPADGRAIYALVIHSPEMYGESSYTLYFSPDAGINWEKRDGLFVTGCYTDVLTGHGKFYDFGVNHIPVNYVGFYSNNNCGGSGNVSDYRFSTDGGRSFKTISSYSQSQSSTSVLTTAGLVRKTAHILGNFNHDQPYDFELSADGGNTWEPISLPYALTKNSTGYFSSPRFWTMPEAPANLLLGNEDGSGDLWLSQNGGKNWQKLGENMPQILMSPYSPDYSLVGIKENHIYTMSLPAAAATHVRPSVPNNAPGGDFFEETQHNMSGIFQKYFYENGGLARFGFPKTEPFREYNPADGKIYVVQYFERARFEYHPENKGTRYEVLLGLLGVELTANYRATQHGAFNRFDDQHYLGGRYFAETGHNLRNSFQTYWETKGGLASYGYPISEEFNEINPDDGKTYVVQYFERARFEWHPENQGTPYEVLLGLFGNALLRQKGWL